MYVDGDIMVPGDVWVDGAKNDKGTVSYINTPLVKQDVEYHTVAVVSERQGGNHFFAPGRDQHRYALDVCGSIRLPCSQEEAMWGQTWGTVLAPARRRSGRCCCRPAIPPDRRTTASTTPRSGTPSSSTAGHSPFPEPGARGGADRRLQRRSALPGQVRHLGRRQPAGEGDALSLSPPPGP